MPLNVSRPKQYEYVEFPKYALGQVVNNAEEEAVVLSGGSVPQPEPPPLAPRVFNAPPDPYAHKDYPKWVKDGAGKDVIANTPAEEAEFAKAVAITNTAVAEQHESEERALLLKVAELEGIAIDKRWGIDKLKKAVMGPKPEKKD